MHKLFEEAMPYCEEKNRAAANMSETAKCVKEITRYPLDDINLYKDIIHYKGLGWTETSISQPDPLVKFKDRVSPTFRKLAEIVRVCKEFGDMDILKEYIDDMKAIGIEIIVHDIPFMKDVQENVKGYMEQMDALQGTICHNANMLRDMGIRAEEEGICPKSEFKDLAEDNYMIRHGVDKSEKLHDRVCTNLLHNKGIMDVLGVNEDGEVIEGVEDNSGEQYGTIIQC